MPHCFKKALGKILRWYLQPSQIYCKVHDISMCTCVEILFLWFCSRFAVNFIVLLIVLFLWLYLRLLWKNSLLVDRGDFIPWLNKIKQTNKETKTKTRNNHIEHKVWPLSGELLQFSWVDNVHWDWFYEIHVDLQDMSFITVAINMRLMLIHSVDNWEKGKGVLFSTSVRPWVVGH